MYNVNFLKSYITFGKFDIDFVFNKIYYPPERELESTSKKKSKTAIIIDNKEFIVKMNSSRYKVFKENTSCYICNLKGSYFLLQQRNIKDSQTPLNSAHFNLYAEDINNINNGNLILMTEDHIIPLSKGGKNCLNNLKTCCHFCNVKKDNIIL